jgi:hypothetical protein
MRPPPYPILRMVEWVKGNRVRLFFSTGRVTEVSLPVKSAKKARVVDYGMGLDPGDGVEFSAPDLYERRGVEICAAGRQSWSDADARWRAEARTARLMPAIRRAKERRRQREDAQDYLRTIAPPEKTTARRRHAG